MNGRPTLVWTAQNEGMCAVRRRVFGLFRDGPQCIRIGARRRPPLVIYIFLAVFGLLVGGFVGFFAAMLVCPQVNIPSCRLLVGGVAGGLAFCGMYAFGLAMVLLGYRLERGLGDLLVCDMEGGVVRVPREGVSIPVSRVKSIERVSGFFRNPGKGKFPMDVHIEAAQPQIVAESEDPSDGIVRIPIATFRPRSGGELHGSDRSLFEPVARLIGVPYREREISFEESPEWPT